MTIHRQAYVITWPMQLVSIGKALEAEGQAALHTHVEQFPAPEIEALHESDPELDLPPFLTRIMGYRVVMPLLYYVLRFTVNRDVPPYATHRIRNDLQALTDEDLARLGVRIAPRSILPNDCCNTYPGLIQAGFLADKRAILRQLQPLGLPFSYPDDILSLKLPGASSSPFNDLLGQLIRDGHLDQGWCFDLLERALRMGARTNGDTLLLLCGVDASWYDRLQTRIPSEVVLRARDLSHKALCGLSESPHALGLIAGGRLAAPERSGEDGWLHAVLKTLGSGTQTTGRARFLTWLVNEGGHEINHRGENLSTPLKLAVYHRSVELAQCLIGLGADLNLPDRRGDTPLHWAAWLGYGELVELLVQQGACVQARNERSKTPQEAADAFGHTKIARFLAERS